jgi:hypothetical protein
MHWTSRIALVSCTAALTATTVRAGPPESAPAPAPVESPELVAARAKDLAAYEAAKGSLSRDDAGAWVVIAGGKIAAKGKDLADVKPAAHDAAHRFVFRVGDEGDRDGLLNNWRAPRLAGLPFVRALGVGFELDPNGSVSLTKGEERATFESHSPFPRIRANIASPDGTPLAAEGAKLPELFLGTVGPELVITPDDAVSLHLERWEVPGTLQVFRGSIPCRRVLVTVSIPGITGDATFIAAYPTVPRERLVDLLRWANHFWSWGAGGPISKMAIEDVPEGEWVVFGNDRVLGHGATPEDAVTAADAETEFAYHRFLLRVPQDLPQPYIPVGGERDKPHVFDLKKSTKTTVTLNGRRVEATPAVDETPDHVVSGFEAVEAATPTYVVSPADAVALHLEMAEAPYDARVVESGDPKAAVRYARAGRAWIGVSVVVDGKPAENHRRLALVVYERPKIPALDDPLPPWPGSDVPGMR